MDFGRVETNVLDQIDFRLPPDTALTQKVLKSSKPKGKPKVYVGCAKWGRPDWVGKIYPPKTKAADFLKVYAQQFNCIELNAVFYRLPTIEGIKKWQSMVGEDFLFCPKFTDVITHVKRLKNVGKETDEFLTVMSELGNNLGPIFLMPHPQMGIKHFETISQFVNDFPKNVPLFVEYRHPEWFDKANHQQAFISLAEAKVGSIITDAAGRRDCVHMNLTTPHAFIRFVGNSLHPTDYQRIDEWVSRIKQWMENGLQSCYFFMHQHDELYSPELCKYLIEQLNNKCGLTIPVPKFYKDLLSV